MLNGIPQGSVLRPVLFLIFINDVTENINTSTFLFADDAKLYTQISNSNDAHMLNGFCREVAHWSDQWLIKVNKAKCNVLSLLSNKNNVINYEYSFGDISDGACKLVHVNYMKD